LTRSTAPRHHVKEIQLLTPEQARTLIQSANNIDSARSSRWATAAGLRLGEALGLRWSDVNLDAGTLSVRQALERSGGDAAARRRLSAQLKALRASLAASPKRSAERRELRQQLEALRKRWREVRTTLKITERSRRAADERFGYRLSSHQL
jgi:integrase